MKYFSKNLHRFYVHKSYWTWAVYHFHIFTSLQPTIPAVASVLRGNFASPSLLLRQTLQQIPSFNPSTVKSRAGLTWSDAVRLDTQPRNVTANTAKIHQAWNAMPHFPLRCGPHKSGSRLHIRCKRRSNLRYSFELWNEIIFSQIYIYTDVSL